MVSAVMQMYRDVALTEPVRTRTTIPVPRVLAWSSDIANDIGAEYIIMEHAVGTPLFRIWDDMDQVKRLKLIENIAQLEKQFSDLKFPAYGYLYFRSSVFAKSRSIPLDPALDPEQVYCVGPTGDRTWATSAPNELYPKLDLGPCKKANCEYEGS
jgi:hypothetical protein